MTPAQLNVCRFGFSPSRILLAVFIALAIIMPSACASIPSAEKVIGEAQPPRKAPTLHGVMGPLSAKQSQAILAKLKREAGETDILSRHLALEEALAGEPLIVGNKVTLLENGPATYAAMFEAIEHATDSINLESFTIDADEVGEKFADLLSAKQQQGVQVSIIYDSVGSLDTPKSFFQKMTDQRVLVTEFNPINPLALKKDWAVNHRDHRKLLVVDGRVAFMGGVNISGVYSSGLSGRSGEHAEKNLAAWRDTHVRIEGPVVARIQQLFIDTWQDQKGAPLSPREYFPPLNESGKDVVRILGRSADSPQSLIYITLISAIRNAEKSVHLTSAYFAPDRELVNELQEAAKRGVDVRLILPSFSDSWAVLYAGHSHYSDLLEAGVKIYERKDALLHAKTGVIDGVWSTVGSTNLDWRSLLYNDEANAVVIGAEFANEMEAMFQRDLGESKLITRAEWKKRPVTDHIKEKAARMWERLL